MGTVNIHDLYSKDPSSLLDILIPSLKNKVSIDPTTMKPSLSVDLLKKKPKEKCLYYLLGHCVIEFSSDFTSSDQSLLGVSAATAKTDLNLSKGETDGAFNTLRNDKLIERCGKNSRHVMYRIPNHRILEVLKLLKIEDGQEDLNDVSRSMAAESKAVTKKVPLVDDGNDYVTREEFNQFQIRFEQLEKEVRSPNPHTTGKAESFREFFLKKKPKSDIEKTICVVYFLEMVKGKTDGVTTSEVREGIQQVRAKVPTNVSQGLIFCFKKGWIDLLRKDKGKAIWTITNTGIGFTERLGESDVKSEDGID